MRIPVSLFALLTSQFAAVAQGTFTYRLLADSTITPHDGGVAVGPSQSLTGVFSWTGVFPSRIVDSMEFNVTSLSFQSESFVLRLADSAQPDSTTQIGPTGGTAVNADVTWQGGGQNPYFLGGFGQGTYIGEAGAPAQLMLTEGLGPQAGGNWVAYLYIDAQLVPEQPTWVLTGLGLAGFLWVNAVRRRPSGP